jgi:hypothetical protein
MVRVIIYCFAECRGAKKHSSLFCSHVGDGENRRIGNSPDDPSSDLNPGRRHSRIPSNSRLRFSLKNAYNTFSQFYKTFLAVLDDFS